MAEGQLIGLRAEFIRQLSDVDASEGGGIATLPQPVLEILSDPVIEQRVPHAASQLRQIRAVLSTRKRQGSHELRDEKGNAFSIAKASPADATQIIAHMVLFSDLTAMPLIGALRFFVSREYSVLSDNPFALERLQSLLDAVRSPALKTAQLAEKARQIGLLFELRGKAIIAAHLITNALFDALLGWPLLVFRRARNSRGSGDFASLSLPIVVDVQFDGRSGAELVVGDAIRDPNVLDAIPGLQSQLAQALDSAKQMWRAKNGHIRERWAEVKGASCTLDLLLAIEICRGTRIAPLWDDRSAAAYLAQLLLARLVGRQVGMTAGISGTIGDQRHERQHSPEAGAMSAEFSILSQDEALISHYVLSRAAAKAFKPGPGLVRDWELGAIKGCEAKVRFARTSQRYHRLILSPDNRLAVPGGAEETYLEINYAYSLTVAADAAQLGGWRPHGYVRCPDIAYLIHTEPALLPPLDFPLVETTRNVLLTNEYSAVRLEAGHTALALAALLSQLNYVWRFARRKPPTSLSWQFIRAVPGETGTRFWHLFLKTLGASDVAIKEHFLRNDTQFTAQLIAGIISGNEQAQRLGCHEAPDLVVVFGARHLWDEGKSELERQEIPLDVTRVFRAIQAEPVIAMREPFELQIGPARIVFIDDDQTYMNTAYFKSLPSVPELPPLIERLSLFDHGFTLQQARYVAGELVHDIVHLKSLLDRAVTRGTIWRHGGSYFVPHALRVDPPPASLELAQTYHALANSLMPGIGRSATSGYGPAECCEVEVAHEAQALLGKALEATDGAKELTKAANDRETSARLSAVELELKCERGLHMRFFELPSWGVLTQLNRNPVCESRRDVLTYAEALLKQAKQYGEIDPRALTTFAQAAAKASFQAWFAGNPGMARSMAERAMEYFDQAKTLADKYSDEQTHDDWLMHVLTWRLAYLEEHNAVASRIKRADRGLSTWMYPKDMIERYQAEALAIAERSDGLGISPDISWYVARADRIEDPAEAGPLYRSAVFRQPTFFGSYLRMFGTLTRDECRRAMLSDPGNNFWRKRLHQVLIWYERNRSRGQTRLTLERLTKGEAEIRRYLGTA